MLHMRCRLFPCLPQGRNRVAVWRIGRQLFQGQAIRLRREHLLHRFARVLPGPLVAHEDGLLGLREHSEPKRRLACSVAAPRRRWGENLPGKSVHAPKALGGLGVAAGGPGRGRSSARPRGAPRAPLGQPGRIATEPQGLALLGRPPHLGPPGVAPLQALGLLEVRGDAPGLRRRTAPMVAECRERVGVVRDAKATLAQVLQHGGLPASRRRATVLRTGFAPLGERLALGWGAWAGAPWRRLGHQTGHTVAEKRVAGSASGWLTGREPLGALVDGVAWRESQQRMEAFSRWQRAAGRGLLATAREWLAGERAEL